MMKALLLSMSGTPYAIDALLLPSRQRRDAARMMRMRHAASMPPRRELLLPCLSVGAHYT